MPCIEKTRMMVMMMMMMIMIMIIIIIIIHCKKSKAIPVQTLRIPGD